MTGMISGFHIIISIASKTGGVWSSAIFLVQQQNFGSRFASKMLILLILCYRQGRRVPQRHRSWVREVYQKRESELGAYHTLQCSTIA